jgi:hypothetical protein
VKWCDIVAIGQLKLNHSNFMRVSTVSDIEFSES